MKEHKAVRKYCAEVGACFVSRRDRQRIMAQLRQMCRGYLEEDPEGGYDDLVARFGTPEQIAAAYVEEMEPQSVLEGFRLRRRIISAVSIGLSAVVLVWMLAVGGALVNEVKHADGYYDVAVQVD